MFTETKREEMLAEFDQGILDLENGTEPSVNRDLSEVAQSAEDLGQFIRKTLINAVYAKLPVGSPSPEQIVRVSLSGLDENEEESDKEILNVSISSSVNSPVKFKDNFSRSLGSVTTNDVIEFFGTVLRGVLDSSLASQNLDALNEFFDWATDAEHADLPYVVRFIPRSVATRSGFLQNISDDLVTFIVDNDQAFTVPDLLILSEPEEDEEEGNLYEVQVREVEKARNNFVESLAGLDRTVDLVGAKLPLVKKLTGIGTHAVSTLVRKAYSHRASGIKRITRRDVDAVVEVDDIVGVISRDGESGKVTVVLSPFHRKTAEASDIDLVSEAEKAIAAG